MEEHPRVRKKRHEVKVNRICRKYNIDIVPDCKANVKANTQQKTMLCNTTPP